MHARYEQALADAEAFEGALHRAQDYHDVRLLLLLSQSAVRLLCDPSAQPTHVHCSMLIFHVWNSCHEQSPSMKMQLPKCFGDGCCWAVAQF